MIERMGTGQRRSNTVKHNGVAYLCGQVGSGDNVTEQAKDCLSRADAAPTTSACFRQAASQHP